MEKDFNSFELGLRIKKAREEAGLTQAQLHDKTGISITQLSGYENGQRNVSLITLSKIAQATNKTLDDIYFGNYAAKPIISAKNHGELIVNCIVSLYDEKVICALLRERNNEYVPNGFGYYYKIGFNEYVNVLNDLVLKLHDFEKNKENYSQPDLFKKQLLEAAINQINSKITIK